MLLVECNVLEQVKVIKEGTEGNSRLRLRGKFQQCDEQNNNGRIYPRKILEAQVQAIQEKIGDRSLVGALDHPANDAIHLSQASHVITGLSVDKDGSVIGECEILSTPNGKIVEALINDGVKIGISSRGVGSVTEGIKGKIVNEDFKLITFDLVSDPSTRGAFPELTESIRENSQRAQQIVSKHKKDRVLLTMLENKITEAMDKKNKKAKKSADSSDDSDLGMLDGTPGVTMKDVLIGRGVIDKDGKKTAKKAKKESIDVRDAVIEGFKRACWGDRYDEMDLGSAAVKARMQKRDAVKAARNAAATKGGKTEDQQSAEREEQARQLRIQQARRGQPENSSTTIERFADVIRERCWKGYKPVKGKKPYSKGSCKKESYKHLGDAILKEMLGSTGGAPKLPKSAQRANTAPKKKRPSFDSKGRYFHPDYLSNNSDGDAPGVAQERADKKTLRDRPKGPVIGSRR